MIYNVYSAQLKTLLFFIGKLFIFKAERESKIVQLNLNVNR